MIIRKEGLPFIAIAGTLAMLLRRTRIWLLGLLPVAFVCWFFRDPERQTPKGDDLFISPADGTILEIQKINDEKIGPCIKVPIFMSVFNVHVNRAPMDGTVIETRYKKGTFHNASFVHKTDANERMVLYFKNDKGMFRVDQVAGLIARRIICWPKKGDSICQGERYGLIRFGSLLECFLPPDSQIMVHQGEKVHAGETIIGRVK